MRLVAIGDLNASAAPLDAILRGTGLVGPDGGWTGGDSHLVQLGDIFNRGGQARQTFAMLQRLRTEARRAGGDVTVLLGNHEVMLALRNEAYCTVEEYLSFATERERDAWPGRVAAAMRRLYSRSSPRGPILPLEPRLELWKVEHAPGRSAMRREVGRRGKLGRAIRRLPVAVRLEHVGFVHAGLSPEWAGLGIDGLNRAAREAWKRAPAFYGDLPRDSVLRHPDGPLWNRALVLGEGKTAEATLDEVLERMGVLRLVVGHTQTRRLAGGRPGAVLSRFDSRLLCIDTSLGLVPEGPSALVIEDRHGFEWSPSGTRSLWKD